MSLSDGSMRIGVDARYLSHGLMGGVHTYLRRLLPMLFECAPADEFILYADRKEPFELTVPPGVTIRTLPWRHTLSTVMNDWKLTRWMTADDVDVAFFPANYGSGPSGVATVVTIHDALNLLPLHQQLRGKGHAASLRNSAKTAYLHMMTGRAAAHATMILTTSAYSRRTIAEASGRSEDDIVPVAHGAPSVRQTDPRDVRQVISQHKLRSRYVLADGLKNPGLLVTAWRSLDPAIRNSLSLVFFSRQPAVLPVLQQAVTSGEARLLVRPSADELAALYRGAAAFVFPSWVEGFGIPLLEAMAHGTPVIASDRGALPEVLGEAGLLVDAEDAVGLAEALNRILTNEAEAARLRSLGCARVATFTWRRAAEMTLSTLRIARDRFRGQLVPSRV
jgi:glycosyltransferase involved in cell wall biosynthesis